MARHWFEQSGSHVDATRKYFVSVCSFTFEFNDTAQIKEALDFYSQRIHPSSRLPDPEWVGKEARIEPAKARRRIDILIDSHHYEIQRWWEKVPLRLQKNGKREKVAKALSNAFEEFSGQQI